MILVHGHELMNAVGPNVSHRRHNPARKFVLHIHVVLNHVRRGMHVVIEANRILGRRGRTAAEEGEWEGRESLRGRDVRRFNVVRRCVGARDDQVVENPEARAN